jgi:hypothetical protein
MRQERLDRYPLRLLYMELARGDRNYALEWVGGDKDPIEMNLRERAKYVASLPEMADEEFEKKRQDVLRKMILWRQKRERERSPEAVEMEVLREEKMRVLMQNERDRKVQEEKEWGEEHPEAKREQEMRRILREEQVRQAKEAAREKSLHVEGLREEMERRSAERREMRQQSREQVEEEEEDERAAMARRARQAAEERAAKNRHKRSRRE